MRTISSGSADSLLLFGRRFSLATYYLQDCHGGEEDGRCLRHEVG